MPRSQVLSMPLAPISLRSLVLLAFLLALATISGALFSEFFGGLVPCALCLEQRIPYYFAVPLIGLIALAWPRLPVELVAGSLLVLGCVFLWSVWLSGYHAGVEWGFWPGPTACSGSTGPLELDLSSFQDMKPVISCETVQFRLLGLSLAGYNFLISLVVASLLLLVAVATIRRKQQC